MGFDAAMVAATVVLVGDGSTVSVGRGVAVGMIRVACGLSVAGGRGVRDGRRVGTRVGVGWGPHDAKARKNKEIRELRAMRELRELARRGIRNSIRGNPFLSCEIVSDYSTSIHESSLFRAAAVVEVFRIHSRMC